MTGRLCLRLLALAAVALGTAAAGCRRDEPNPSGAARAGTAAGAAREWTASAISRDPEGYLAEKTAELDRAAKRLRAEESDLQAQLLAANRELAGVRRREREARTFGSKVQAALHDASTRYPHRIDGREFPSRTALLAERDATRRTVEQAMGAAPKLESTAARIGADLAKASKGLAANAAARGSFELKARALRAAASERNVAELSAIAARLAGDADAALPDEELFAPPVSALGADADPADDFPF